MSADDVVAVQRQPGPPGRERLFLPWVAFAAVCTAVMAIASSDEVIPYHLIWIGFALAYGFEPWPVRRAAIAAAAFGAASGAVLVQRAATDVISWDETFEIPLMVTLAGLVVWHVQRRETALRTVRTLADRQTRQAAQRERLSRLSAHEMRTPLTIATSYVALMTHQETDADRLSDLRVVEDELSRLARAGDRVLRMIRLTDHLPRSWIDVDDLLQVTARRWSSVAPRDWRVESDAGRLHASLERVRACLDTLIENALRYTTEQDTIRLYGTSVGDEVHLGVADSGPGLSEDQISRINSPSRRPPPAPDQQTPDPLSQTGLGIGLVQQIVEAREGTLVAGKAREGGAQFELRMPRERGVR